MGTRRTLSRAVAMATALAVAGLVVAWFAALASASPGCSTGIVSFASIGAEQCYVVPSGVTEVRVVAAGGGAADAGSGERGGEGASITGDLPASPGETLFVEVGGDGGEGSGASPAFNGGGVGGVNGASYSGGGGGGASDVRTCSRTAASCPVARAPLRRGCSWQAVAVAAPSMEASMVPRAF